MMSEKRVNVGLLSWSDAYLKRISFAVIRSASGGYKL
jgi:hypothetical protein